MLGRSITRRGGLSRLSIVGFGASAALVRISTAGPSASEVTLTERKTAARGVRKIVTRGTGAADSCFGFAAGDCARQILVPSPARSKSRKNSRPLRGRNFISGETSILKRYHRGASRRRGAMRPEVQDVEGRVVKGGPIGLGLGSGSVWN